MGECFAAELTLVDFSFHEHCFNELRSREILSKIVLGFSFLLLPPVLKPYLDLGSRCVGQLGQLAKSLTVNVLAALKKAFKLLNLLRSEQGPIPAIWQSLQCNF